MAFRPSTGPRAFVEAPGYLTLLVLGNFITGIGGTEQGISEPCARYPVWLAEIMKDEQILFKSGPIS